MVLALAWAVYLIPKALKHHDEVARTRSVDRFSRPMRVLARREPVNRRDAGSSSRRPRRRRQPAVRRPATGARPAPARPPCRRRRAAAAAAAGRRRILSFLLLAIAGGRRAWPRFAVVPLVVGRDPGRA